VQTHEEPVRENPTINRKIGRTADVLVTTLRQCVIASSQLVRNRRLARLCDYVLSPEVVAELDEAASDRFVRLRAEKPSVA
jgi:hypothetical protein